jgi:hypothetical protein
VVGHEGVGGHWDSRVLAVLQGAHGHQGVREQEWDGGSGGQRWWVRDLGDWRLWVREQAWVWVEQPGVGWSWSSGVGEEAHWVGCGCGLG